MMFERIDRSGTKDIIKLDVLISQLH